MSVKEYYRRPKCGQGIWNIIQHGKAKLSDAEYELHILYCFLEKKWISKPSDFEEIDPEIKAGLITILEMESKKAQKEQNKVEAEKTLSSMKARVGL